jgi:cytochrome c oxidase cbb3-type subunit 3
MRKVAAVVVICFVATVVWAQPPEQAPPAGRGGRGGRGAGGGGGGRPLTFPQQTRPLASAEVLARGKAVYGVNCTACHGADLRGGDQGGPSLLRSLSALSDQHGETIGPIVRGARQDKGMPGFNLNDADVTAVAEYIHSVLAKVGNQARPPGAIDPSTLDVLVGSASAGESYFHAKCAGCHSTTADLKAIASKYSDPRTLQNMWVSGGGGGGRGGRGGGENAKPSTVTVTLASGQKLEGLLVRKDDFIVTLTLPDGTRRSIAREGDAPKVDVHDPNEAHKKLVPTLDDKDMHDVTAYLATIK